MARCEAAGPEEAKVYSLEYIEDFFWPSMTQMVTDRSPQWNGNVGQAPRPRSFPLSTAQTFHGLMAIGPFLIRTDRIVQPLGLNQKVPPSHGLGDWGKTQ